MLDLVARGEASLDEPLELPPRTSARRRRDPQAARGRPAQPARPRRADDLPLRQRRHERGARAHGRRGGRHRYLDGIGLRRDAHARARRLHAHRPLAGGGDRHDHAARAGRAAGGAGPRRAAHARALRVPARRPAPPALPGSAAALAGLEPVRAVPRARHDLQVGNKSGELDGLRADVGLVSLRGRGTLAAAIFTDGGSDLREARTSKGRSRSRSARPRSRRTCSISTADARYTSSR